jgi:hypothetical protein
MPDPNATRVAEKKARFATIKKNMATPRVRVLPANDELRRVLRHPRGMRFRSTGSVEWPHDSFTTRRLADGSIKLDEEHASAPHHAPTVHHSPT